MVGWIAFQEAQLSVNEGALTTYEGKNGAQRQFCTVCGTGLFYRNADMLPGIVDIQSATLDNAGQEAPGAQIQVAERLPWMESLAATPEFARYPGP